MTSPRARIQSRRNGGNPSRTSCPWGPLVSYTCSGGSPPDERDLAHRHLQRSDMDLCANSDASPERKPLKSPRSVRLQADHLAKGVRILVGTALPSPVSTGSGSKGVVSIAAVISGIPLAVS